MFPFGSSAAPTRRATGVPVGTIAVEPRAVVCVFGASWTVRSATPAQAVSCPFNGFVQVMLNVTENCSERPPFTCSVLPVVVQEAPEQLAADEAMVAGAPPVPGCT